MIRSNLRAIDFRIRFDLLAILLLWVPLAFLEAPRPALAGETSNAGTQGVQPRLRTDRSLYKPGEEIEFEIIVENVREVPVALYSRLLWGPIGGLTLQIETSKGEPIEPDASDHDFPNPASLAEPTQLVTLQPRHFLGIHRRDPISSLLPAPGTYRLWVEYRSPIPASLTKAKYVLTRDAGVFPSPKIEVRVVSPD
jgi:hypothetical protein